MSAAKQTVIEQLRYGCRHSAAEWGATLTRNRGQWQIEHAHGLKRKQRKALAEYLSAGETGRWLEKASSQNSSYRTIGEEHAALGVERLYAIPDAKQRKTLAERFLVVGGGTLSRSDLKYFRALIRSAGEQQPEETAPRITLPPEAGVRSVGVSLGLEENLLVILDTLTKVMICPYGLLAIRSGDEYTIHALCGLPDDLMGMTIQVEEDTALAERIAGFQAFTLNERLALGDAKKTAELPKAEWMVMPLVIGQRVIALGVLGRKEKIQQADIDAATAIGGHVAPSIEKSIMGVEAAYYLQRFALLNELAGFASSGMELHQVVQRGEAIFRRAFGAQHVKIMLYDEDRQEFRTYAAGGSGEVVRQPAKTMSLERSVMGIGQVLRVGNIAKITSNLSTYPEMAAKMVVPLRFRGRVIGVISLESSQPDVFTEQDEKFVPVVASQLASILISLRLNAEMRRRARAMEAVNEIAQEILGLDDVSLIADRTAKLMAQKFEYGMVLVMLLDEGMEELIAEGVAGANAADVPRGFRFSKSLGIPGEVMAFGESVLLPNVEDSANYVPIPGWEPGSGIWVPLRTGTELFGVVSVEFQKKSRVDKDDLAVLEAIAGILSSVLTNARQYDQLQQSVLQLEAVRETSLDIGADLDLQTLLKRVVNRVRTLLDAHGAELGFVDRENEMVEVLVSENPWQEYSGYRFEFNSGVTGRVAASGEALTIADFNSWGGRADSVFKAPFSTVAGVPLKLMGETIGTLVVQDDRPAREFTQNDIRTLELLAPQLAIFIRNARLYQELEMRMEAQRLAEERLVRSAKLAAVGEMAAAVAHELNNPLTTVTGFAELILESMEENSPEYEDMSLVLSEAQRSRTVVRRLLDFSRQSELLRVDTDLNEIISTVLQLVHHLAQTENIQVRMELWGDIPQIRADRSQIQQVILNLVHNAIQAMPEGGELIVASVMEEREGQTWLGIRVKDNGIGIDEADLPQIFEPFFTTKPSGQGTGLGLSVSYSIVSEHGGYIEVSSTKGVGSVFVIWLPAEREGIKE